LIIGTNTINPDFITIQNKKRRDYSEEWIVPSLAFVRSRVDLFCDTPSETLPSKENITAKNAIKLIFS